MKFVSCLAWVSQGIPSQRPQRVELPKEELEELLQGVPAETSEGEDDEEEKPTSSKGLRGSGGNSDASDDDDDDTERRYKMSDYDKEEEEKDEVKSAVKGLACYADDNNDPFITHHDEDDEDKDDFLLRIDDNELLVGKIVKDQYNLEVWVFNASSDDFYSHHDYILETPPLCLCSIGYDPGEEESNRGNLCAVGTMTPEIGLWDLDLVDSLEPILSLGSDNSNPSKAKKKKKHDVSVCHSDAVLSLCWNSNAPHVLASGSADNSIVLWDLEQAKGSTKLEKHKDKVQSIRWHPAESTLLLSGGCDGRLLLWDCRTSESEKKWKVKGEVEEVIWDKFNPFCFVVGTDKGSLHYYDSRQSKEELFSIAEAHEDGLRGLCLNSKVKGCLATAGMDTVKLWKIEKSFQSAGEFEPKLGHLHAVRFCPDTKSTLALAGEKGDFVRLFDIKKCNRAMEMFDLN